jgi:hypothetical protein
MKRFARYIRRERGTMNKTEEAYSRHLETLRIAGENNGFMFEAMKFRLADNTFYTPDFIVFAADGVIEAHEVKGGYIFDDAMVKLKVVAELFPFRFYLCQKKRAKDPFTITQINP